MTHPTDNNNPFNDDIFIVEDPGTVRIKDQNIGATKVDAKTQFTTKIRVTYLIPQSYTTFFPRQKHFKTMNALKRAAPELKIIPNDNSTAYTDPEAHPTDETTFEKQFTIIRTSNNATLKVTICHTITTHNTINDIKFSTNPANESLKAWLIKNRIWIEVDKFDRQEIAQIGYFTEVHHWFFHRDDFKNEVREALEDFYNNDDEAMDDKEEVNIPDFDVYPIMISIGKGHEEVKARVIGISCKAIEGQKLNEMLVESKIQDYLASGTFIPQGMSQMTDVETRKKILRLNNKWLMEAQCITIYGLTHEAATYKLSTRRNSSEKVKNLPLREILEGYNSILAMYPTQQT